MQAVIVEICIVQGALSMRWTRETLNKTGVQINKRLK